MRIAREGFRFIGALSLLGAGALAVPATRFLAAPLFGLAGFVTFFFRDPERVPPEGEHLLVAPGDGLVVHSGPGERDPSLQQVSIFLSIFDVHINRAPMTGVVQRVHYTPGRFLAAYKPQAGTANEQNEIALANENFGIVVRQIAGVVARRIVCAIREGDRVERGERIGLIQFGSRMDVVMPSEVELRVKVGDKVKGGETVIAERL